MKLSICIPTYNRARFLPDLFDSILSQPEWSRDIEVVVSDNASTDNTTEIVTEYQSRIPNLVYSRSNDNIGPDRNFLRVISLASGEYCWLMGSDDKFELGSIAEVGAALQRYPGIAGVTVNRNAYKFDLSTRMFERPVTLGLTSQDCYLRSADEIFSFIGYYVGYISAQIVRRDLWNKVVKNFPVDNYLNGYVHIYVIGRITQLEPEWLYLSRPCVGWRSANDSFVRKGGEFERMALDVVGYETISRALFGLDSPTYRIINSAVSSVLVRNAIMTAKLEGADGKFLKKSPRLLLETYWRYPAFWAFSVPLLLTPARAIKLIRWCYRLTLKRHRVHALEAGPGK